jgi:hypothetical protein
MQHRQPGFARRVEAPRCDLAQALGRGFAPVFGIDLEQQRDLRRRRRLDTSQRAPQGTPAEHAAERRAQHGGAARADPGYLLEAAVVGRDLERLEGFHVQGVVDLVGQNRSDPRDRAEHLLGLQGAAQALELHPATTVDHLADRRGDRTANPGQG